MADVQIVARVDDEYALYVNGVLAMSGNDWQSVQSVLWNVQPGDVIAIRAVDTWGPGGAFVDIVLPDGTHLATSSAWKVSNTAPADWNSKTFNDAAWANASDYGALNFYPQNESGPPIPSNSPGRWIWDATNTPEMGPDNDVVYFRFTIPSFSPPPPPPPPPADTLSFAGTTVEAKVVDLVNNTVVNVARVLPLGDSITAGVEAGRPSELWEGYRDDLFTLLTNAGLWINYVGDYQDGPDLLRDKDHQGVPGIQAGQVAPDASSIAVRLQPDVVLLLLGTNEALRLANAATVVPQYLSNIMRDLATNAPSVKILLSALPPLDPDVYRQAFPELRADGDDLVNAINAQLSSVVAASRNNGVDAVFVPMPSLSTADLGDGIHPNNTGYSEMTAAWFAALTSNLSTAGGTLGGTPQVVSIDVRNVIGSEQGDLLRGDEFANVLEGRGGADRLEGRGGDDILKGGAGNDEIFGGAGDDIVWLAAPRANYQFVRNVDGSVTVTDLTGVEGRERMTDVERIGFQNGTDVRLLSSLVTIPGAQTPYNATQTPWLVDADGVTVQATNFDAGGQGISYNDDAGLVPEGRGVRPGTDVETATVPGGTVIGWTRVGEWVEYTINVEQAGVYTLALETGTPNAGRNITANFTKDGVTYRDTGPLATPVTGAYDTFTTRNVTVALEPGVQVLRLTFGGGNDQDLKSFSIAPTSPPPPPPPPPPPSIAITAVAALVTEGSPSVADFQITLNAVQSQDVLVYLSTTSGTATAGQDFSALSPTVPLTIRAGTLSTILRLPLIDDALTEANEPFSVNIVSATLAGASIAITTPSASTTIVDNDAPQPVQTPFNATQTPWLVDADGVTVQATNFDAGGQGISYNDDAGLVPGGRGVRPETDVETATVPGGTVIGWTRVGEWVEYTINVEQAGVYTLALETGTPNAGRNITANFTKDGVTYRDTGPLATPVTGAYDTFTTRNVTVALEPGVQVLRLTFGGGNDQDLKSFSIVPTSPPPPPPPPPPPSIAITAVAATVSEGSPSVADFQISLNAVQSQDVLVYLSTTSGTATAGQDFSALSPTVPLTIRAGTLSTILRLPLIDDALTEANESFSVNIISATMAGAPIAITTPSASTTIVDNDAPQPVQTPFNATQTPWLVDADGVTVQATNFDAGGQGISYNDDAGLVPGGRGVRPETDVETATVPGGTVIGWTRVGEWVEYTINVEQAGVYTLALETGTPNAGRNITANFTKDGVTYRDTGPLATPVTGAYDTFTTSEVAVTLEPGVQVLRLTFGGGNDQDLKSFSIAPTRSVDLGALNSSQGFRIDAVAREDTLGDSVASIGDINGDGFDDVIIGAPRSGADQGAAYVLFGRASDFGNVDLALLTSNQGFRIEGELPGDFAGISVASAGDVNGDGFDDVVIGARGADSAVGENTGSSYVLFGKAVGFSNISLAALTAQQGFRITGAWPNQNHGNRVASAGDYNGDGFDDLIVGGYSEATFITSSYLIFGKPSGFGNVDLAALTPTQGFRINGAASLDRSGSSLASAGDINGDGFDDVIIGAYEADPAGRNAAGSSYVLFGKSSGHATVDLASLTSAQGFRIDGETGFDQSGISVASAGDLNGDGFAELVVGAMFADPNGRDYAGSSYVLFGKPDGFTNVDLATLTTVQGFRVAGAQANSLSGRSVAAAGDVNGDGFDDLIVGAFQAGPHGRDDAGSSYVIFGKATGFTNIDLANLTRAEGFRIDGASPHDKSGWSVSSAGDMNADGFDDLIIGAFGADTYTGSAYVLFGSATGAMTTSATVQTPNDQTLLSLGAAPPTASTQMLRGDPLEADVVDAAQPSADAGFDEFEWAPANLLFAGKPQLDLDDLLRFGDLSTDRLTRQDLSERFDFVWDAHLRDNSPADLNAFASIRVFEERLELHNAVHGNSGMWEPAIG